MTRFAVAINPVAGSRRGADHGRRVLSDLRDAGHSCVDVSGDSMESALANTRRAIADGIDAVIVVGGDGMTHLGINAVAQTGVPLGIVAAGTGNDIARALTLPIHDVPASLQEIMTGLRTGGRPIDASRVNAMGHHASEWFLGILSAGFDAEVNERANGMRWPSGYLRYVRAVLAQLSGLTAYDYRVTIDGVLVWDQPGMLLAVANGTTLGGGLMLVPHARFDDGLLDVILVDRVTRRELLKVLPKIYRGQHVDHPAVHFFTGRDVLIEPGEPTKRRPVPPPVAYADGERMGPAPIRCSVESHAVQLLQSPHWHSHA